MKPTAILAVAIFLLCAPAPDSAVISEMSHGFLSQVEVAPLLASESTAPAPQTLLKKDPEETAGKS